MANDQSAFLPSSQPIEIIEGDITSTSNRNDLSTLDEPVFETIKRLYILIKITKKNHFYFILKVILLVYFENLIMHLFHDNHLHFYNNGIYGDH